MHFVIALVLDLGLRLHQNSAAVAVVFLRRSNVAAFVAAAGAPAVLIPISLAQPPKFIRTGRLNPN